MPAAIPAVPGAQVVKALERVGFTLVRVSGSHHLLRHGDGRTVVVPVHGGHDLPKGTLRNVLAIIGMTPDELRKLL
ncbi:MAG: type II toxin-antitoxin system HicA family toxin [Micromonosporaceae bacterium]|nr:type II toxin-antitoxin system HicA family toxin [Micromonosporaceae bacterium]